MTQHYDVAVIGGQPSGVIAAALLAKRGRRVALLDHGENTTHYRRKGLKLPLVPTLVPYFEDSPPMLRVHDELGLGPDLRTATEAMDPLFQAIMPEHRIDVRREREALLEELGQEFPDMVDPVARFFDRLFALDDEISGVLDALPALPPVGLRQKWRAKRLLAQLAHLDAPFESQDLFVGIPADHPLREMLLGPLAFFGYLANETPSTLHAVRLIARYYRGTVLFSDRLGELNAELLKVADQAGVEIRNGAVVKEIDVHRRYLKELRVAGLKHSITADYFVANTMSGFQELLPPTKIQARYALAQRTVRPRGSLLVLNLVVRQRVIPRGMGIAAFLLNGRRHERGAEGADPPLFLRRYPASRRRPAKGEKAGNHEDPEYEILSIACPVDTDEVAKSPGRIAALRQQMHSRLGRLVPFLDHHVTDESMPLDTSNWDVEAEDVAHRIDPWAFHPIYAPATRPLLGVASRPTRTVFKNLVHCGRDVYPGLGLEGEYLTGLTAADTLATIAGRNWRI